MRAMRKRALLLALGFLAMGLGSASVTEAKRPPRPPMVNGGGMAMNMRNVQAEGPPGVAFAGFTARATGPETPDGYPARGQVQLVVRFDAPDGLPIARVHGQVVCMWNHGDPLVTDHKGDSTSDADVWEIRFRVTKTNLFNVPPGFDPYLSIYVQDGGRRGNDFVGEGFHLVSNPGCGLGADDDGEEGWDLEPLIRGNATVH
jgi:hypothetical protein